MKIGKIDLHSDWNLAKYSLHPDFDKELKTFVKTEVSKSCEASKKGEWYKPLELNEVIPRLLKSLKSNYPDWQPNLSQQTSQIFENHANQA